MAEEENSEETVGVRPPNFDEILGDIEAEEAEEKKAPEEPAVEVLAAGANAAQPVRSTGSGLAQPPMGENFNNNENVTQHIERVREQLGIIGQFVHDRDVRKVQRKHIAALTKELFRYQYDDLQHHLMLSMDVQKKKRFVQYMEASKDIQGQIQSKSAEAMSSITAQFYDNLMDGYDAKQIREGKLAQAFQGKKLREDQFRREMELSEQMFEDHRQRIIQTAEDMIANHSKFLYATMALFETDKIKN